MIGLSVSFCIAEIIDGKVEEHAVERIIAATAAHSYQDWEYVIASYRKAYWYKNPELGEAICWRFIADNKIEQPRLTTSPHPGIRQGIWLS